MPRSHRLITDRLRMAYGFLIDVNGDGFTFIPSLCAMIHIAQSTSPQWSV